MKIFSLKDYFPFTLYTIFFDRPASPLHQFDCRLGRATRRDRGNEEYGVFADDVCFANVLIWSTSRAFPRQDESTSTVIPCEVRILITSGTSVVPRVTRKWGTRACVSRMARRGMLKFMHGPAVTDVLHTATWISSYYRIHEASSENLAGSPRVPANP